MESIGISYKQYHMFGTLSSVVGCQSDHLWHISNYMRFKHYAKNSTVCMVCLVENSGRKYSIFGTFGRTSKNMTWYLKTFYFYVSFRHRTYFCGFFDYTYVGLKRKLEKIGTTISFYSSFSSVVWCWNLLKLYVLFVSLNHHHLV